MIGNLSDAAFNDPEKAIVVSAGDDGSGSAPGPLTRDRRRRPGLTLNARVATAASAHGGRTPRMLGAPTPAALRRRSATAWGCPPCSPSGRKPFQTAAAGWASTHCGKAPRRQRRRGRRRPEQRLGDLRRLEGRVHPGRGHQLAAPLIAAVFALKGNATTTNYPASLLDAKLGTSSFHEVKTGTDDAGNWPLACPAGDDPVHRQVRIRPAHGRGHAEGLGRLQTT